MIIIIIKYYNSIVIDTMVNQIISQALLADNALCKVLYNKAKDKVELEIGGTSIRLEARQFFLMNEMLRKAVARLAMQTEFSK